MSELEVQIWSSQILLGWKSPPGSFSVTMRIAAHAFPLNIIELNLSPVDSTANYPFWPAPKRQINASNSTPLTRPTNHPSSHTFIRCHINGFSSAKRLTFLNLQRMQAAKTRGFSELHFQSWASSQSLACMVRKRLAHQPFGKLYNARLHEAMH